jgi:NADH:ubiquinone oxidoreductase subunit E
MKGKIPEEEIPKEEFPPSMISELDRVIKEYKNKPGSTIPVLQRAQEIVGYLPPIIQKRIARGLNVSTADVHSIVSFYSFFSMKPRGEHIVKVCLGTACYVKGIEAVVNKLKEELKIEMGGITDDKRFSMESVRCLGACGLAPVMVIDQDTHGTLEPKKVAQILDEYRPVSKETT